MPHTVGILGAGPAGCACAIELLQAGFQVTVWDRAFFPRHQPGESLHPGIEPLLNQLGLGKVIEKHGFLRFAGIESYSQGKKVFSPFKADRSWQGFQLFREEFDSLLLNQVRLLGGKVLLGERPMAIQQDLAGNIQRIQGQHHRLAADFFIDATGKRAWLARECAIGFTQTGAQKIAYYGYVMRHEGDPYTHPRIIWDNTGWTWVAQVKADMLSWVRLDLAQFQKRPANWLPDPLKHHHPTGTRGAVDVSWRMANTVSAHNYFLVGDAAAVIDPASSHGVLKAIMSGMMVAHLLAQQDRFPLESLHTHYRKWMHSWFSHDIGVLQKLYQEKGLGFMDANRPKSTP